MPYCEASKVSAAKLSDIPAKARNKMNNVFFHITINTKNVCYLRSTSGDGNEESDAKFYVNFKFVSRLHMWRKMTRGVAVLLGIPVDENITFCHQYYYMAPKRGSCISDTRSETI